ncbi:hypothetical protein [Pseudorhodobacter aquimaris]|uniref:hypothetical protein n=1 Tax=Pseudorhodobacter aquimaris TaxID=687412 RepID=UPI00067C81D2|nr:hypothetical protein [Pseudorhodobacter aquimaris]
MQDSDLDDLFSTARRHSVGASPDLMARVLADAEAHQPRMAAPTAVAKPGWWAALLAAIGGLPALAGLSTATLAGLWIGFADPTGVNVVTDMILASGEVTETLDVMPAYDDFLFEG